MIFVSLEKAALIAAFFFFSLIVRAEGSGQLIEKAQNLLLQKDRNQALLLLQNSLKSDPKNQAIKDALTDVFAIYLTNQGVQGYELGLSQLQKGSDVAAALSPYSLTEGDLKDYVLLLARYYLRKDDLKSAQTTVEKVIPTLDLFEEGQLLLAQINFLKNPLAPLEAWEKKKRTLKIFWATLSLEQALRAGESAEVDRLLKLIRTEDSLYPELYFYDWLIAMKKNETTNQQELQKYVSVCKTLSASQWRKYILNPALCSRMKDVESKKVPSIYQSFVSRTSRP